jgi:hypothetical protein
LWYAQHLPSWDPILIIIITGIVIPTPETAVPRHTGKKKEEVYALECQQKRHASILSVWDLNLGEFKGLMGI